MLSQRLTIDSTMSQVPAHAVAATAGQLGDMQLNSSSSDSLAGLRARVHCFTEQAPDATIQFQIIDLGLQVYIWVAVGGAKLQNMYLAIQSKQAAVPSVATLLPDATSTSASSMAQRLAMRVGRPVVCSCNLPQNNETLQVIAERRLIQELKAMGLTASPTAAAAAAAAESRQGPQSLPPSAAAAAQPPPPLPAAAAAAEAAAETRTAVGSS